jgi:hypothetical protein
MLGSRRLIIQRAVTRLTRSDGSRPELRLLDAAAQAGIVSVARIERMDAEKQYQQRRHQRTATHAGQTHYGADDKTGERIEPVHGRYDSALVHHWDMIRGSDGRASMLDGGLSEFVLAKGTCCSQRTSPPTAGDSR